LKVMVTGAGGLVGRAAVSAFTAGGDDVIGLTHADLDITNEAAVREQIVAPAPDLVLNCAAWTDVDGCEHDRGRAFQANAIGPELLAQACRGLNARFITISTDYVFDGARDGFYTQRDQPNPQSVYAHSKLEGERRAQNAWARTIVVRSGYIFGAGGTNFLCTFIDRARAGQHLKVINDSYGTPTYAPHLAARIRELAVRDLPGLYHVVNSGEGVSFAQFAVAAFDIAGLDPALLQPVSEASLQRPAPRPQNSRLRCLLSDAIGLPEMPYWHDALREHAAPVKRASGLQIA